MRILIADDYKPGRDSLAQLCAVLGHETRAVNDGQELLDVLHEIDWFDLVIADDDMPLITGLEVLIRLREDERWKDLAVILCSGRTEVREQVLALDAVFYDKAGYGMVAVIEKASRTLRDKIASA